MSMKSQGNKAKNDANRWIKKNISGDKSVLTLIMIILAILFPPLPVFLTVGFETHFWINILLTLLGYIPGVIHAIYVLMTER